MYREGKLTSTQLDSAVTKGWITDAQKQTIMTPQ